MSSISAGTTSGTALVSSGDTTGQLVFKTNGSTTALTLNTDQTATFVGAISAPSISIGGGALPVSSGGTGATTLTGVIKGNGTSAFTASNVSLTSEVTGTLPVANGGTGTTSLTANNVILGNGTSSVQFVAPGSSGNVLTSNGTTWQSSAPAAGGFSNMTVFTSSGTWSVPSGVTKCMVVCTGGGGSSYNTSATRESGGGAGATAIRTYTLSGGSATVTVGAGAGATSQGGQSSFVYGATTITADGGFSSTGGTRNARPGGTASGGDINIDGGDGDGADSNNGGAGGASYWGGGGGGSNQSGGVGKAYGSGGGGNGVNGSSNYTNSGKQGIVVIYY
jgi:hypothetical protein